MENWNQPVALLCQAPLRYWRRNVEHVYIVPFLHYLPCYRQLLAIACSISASQKVLWLRSTGRTRHRLALVPGQVDQGSWPIRHTMFASNLKRYIRYCIFMIFWIHNINRLENLKRMLRQSATSRVQPELEKRWRSAWRAIRAVCRTKPRPEWTSAGTISCSLQTATTWTILGERMTGTVATSSIRTTPSRPKILQWPPGFRLPCVVSHFKALYIKWTSFHDCRVVIEHSERETFPLLLRNGRQRSWRHCQ